MFGVVFYLLSRKFFNDHKEAELVSEDENKHDDVQRRRPSLRRQRAKDAPWDKVSLESVMSEFYLSNKTLHRMIAQMDSDMDRGLIGGLRSSTIAMLPSFVPELPDGSETGRYLAMDLGGTNLRVMLMELSGDGEVHTEQRNYRTPNWAMSGTGNELFDFIVKSLADFLDEKELKEAGLALGFTFSYPCDQTGIRSAKLLRWTKGFNATGVEGQDVVKLLEDAIRRKPDIHVRVVALVNDTVGTQVATAFESGRCDLGVIVATGTNASYMERIGKIEKLSDLSDNDFPFKQMIIDTEWGGFGDRYEAEYIVTQYDRVIDQNSVHPGVQIFDKLVAGMYMGEVVRLVLLNLINAGIIFEGMGSEVIETPMSFPTKYISEIVSDEGGTYYNTRQILDELAIDVYEFNDILVMREVCMVVSRRSANLVAAAVTCCMKRVGKKKITIGIDGSTYRYHPFYHYWVNDKIRELIGSETEFTIVQAGDGSGKGAALVAAIAEKMNAQNQIPNGTV